MNSHRCFHRADEALQKIEPSMHVIIEAHPVVYQKMITDGWDKKPNVRICFGRWQVELPKLLNEPSTIGSFTDYKKQVSHHKLNERLYSA